MNEGPFRVTATTYDDLNRKVTTKSDLRNAGDGLLQSVTHYDQLGRVRLTRSSDGSPLSATGEGDGIKVQTIRVTAAGGNYEIVSNPHRTTSDRTMGWTCALYDTAGRVT